MLWLLVIFFLPSCAKNSITKAFEIDKNYITVDPFDNAYPQSTLTAFSCLRQETKIMENMVVTGLKFEKVDNIIHIRIKEGQLLPGGQVGREQWQNLDRIEKTDGKFTLIDKNNPNDAPWPLQKDFNVHVFEIFDLKKTVNLDNIITPKNYVVTGINLLGNLINEMLLGVKMSQEPSDIYKEQQSIGFEIQITPFNLTTGQLTVNGVDYSKWITSKTFISDEKNPERENLAVTNFNVSETLESMTKISTDNQYIEFIRPYKSFYMYPLLNGREVESKPARPLSTVNLSCFGSENKCKYLTFTVTPIET